mgnify:CR=1 FL=1
MNIKNIIKLLLFTILTCIAFSTCKDSVMDGSDDSPIDQNGGSFTQNGVTISVPEGALTKSVSFSAKVINDVADLGTGTDPDLFCVGVKLGPSGTIFQKPVTVTVPLVKEVKGDKLIVQYWNQESNAWIGTAIAEVNGKVAKFKVSHFSSYALCEAVSSTLVEEMSKSAKGEGGDFSRLGDNCIDLILNNLDMMNVWVEKGGHYYHPVELSATCNYFVNGKEGQVAAKCGENTSGHNHYAVFDAYYSSATEVVEKEAGKSFAENCKGEQELYEVLLNRTMEMVNPDIIIEPQGTISRKGEKTEVRIRVVTQHVKETKTYPLIAQYSENGSIKEVTREVTITDSGNDEQYPCAGYVVTLTNSNNDAFKLDRTTVTTDQDGYATFTVTALKDDAKGTITALYQYSDSEDKVKSESVLSLGTSSDDWEVTAEINVKTGSLGGPDYSYKIHTIIKLRDFTIEGETIYCSNGEDAVITMETPETKVWSHPYEHSHGVDDMGNEIVKSHTKVYTEKVDKCNTPIKEESYAVFPNNNQDHNLLLGWGSFIESDESFFSDEESDISDEDFEKQPLFSYTTVMDPNCRGGVTTSESAIYKPMFISLPLKEGTFILTGAADMNDIPNALAADGIAYVFGFVEHMVMQEAESGGSVTGSVTVKRVNTSSK